MLMRMMKKSIMILIMIMIAGCALLLLFSSMIQRQIAFCSAVSTIWLSLQSIWEIYWLWQWFDLLVKSLQCFASSVKASQALLLKTSMKICPTVGMIRGFCQVHWRTAGRLELSFQRTDLETFVVMTCETHDPKTQRWRWVCKIPEECGIWCDFDFQRASNCGKGSNRHCTRSSCMTMTRVPLFAQSFE